MSQLLHSVCDYGEAFNSCIGEFNELGKLDDYLANISDEKMAIEGNFSDAFIWANTIYDETLRLELEDDIANTWVLVEPELAFQWAIDNQRVDSIGLRAIRELVSNDIWYAHNLVVLSPLPYQDTLFEAMVETLVSEQRFVDLVSLVDHTPISINRGRLYEAYIQSWAAIEPEAVVSHLLEQAPNQSRNRQLAIASKYWGEQAPEHALSYFSNIDDEGLKKSVWVAILTSWSYKDLSSATYWLDQQSHSATLDKTIARVGNGLISRGVEKYKLSDWFNLIDNQELRDMMIKRAEKGHL